MTQAYIEGFCKAAEAYGVDPEELVKVAAVNPSAAANAAAFMARAFGKIPAGMSNRTAASIKVRVPAPVQFQLPNYASEEIARMI